MQKLSMMRYADAVKFLDAHGRPLERALHRFAFHDGGAGPVVRALAAYQNDDGGFGHSLEPDANAAESSVLDTTHGLQVMRRLGVSTDTPILAAAMDFLRRAYDGTLGGWPIRPFISTETISAPWWKYESFERWREQVQAGRLNPTAEVLGYFLDHGQPGDRALIDAVTGQVSRWIGETDGPLENHELLCLARLTRTAKLNEGLRRDWRDRVRRDVAATVNPDPASWGGYGLRPWWVTQTPGDALLGDLQPGLADAMLDDAAARQEDDGGWPPFWDWGGRHGEAWPAARRAWKSVLTEQMLRVLRHHGRFPGAAA